MKNYKNGLTNYHDDVKALNSAKYIFKNNVIR